MTAPSDPSDDRPRLIALTGGSGSGKSTLAAALQTRLPAGVVRLVVEDDYYGDHGGHPDFDAATFDFDDVAAKDHALLAEHLTALRARKAVEVPDYSFETHRRLPTSKRLEPAPIVIVEGAHLLCTPALARLFDLKVFVDTPADIRFIRRLIRDQAHRGRSAESVIGQYLGTVRPGHERLIEPSRRVADLVLSDSRGAVVPDDPGAMDALLTPVITHPVFRRWTQAQGR